MTSGVYARTEYHRRILSESRKGRVKEHHFKKGSTPWNKGKKGVYSKETLRDMSKSALGRKWSEETRKKHEVFRSNIEPNKKRVKWTEERRRKSILAHKGKMMGDKSPFWKGGISKQSDYQHLQREKRRALERGVAPLKKETLQLVYEDNIKKYGTLTCEYCRKSLKFGGDSLDHKTPLARKGNNNYSNLCICCRLCNSRKGKKTVIEYKEYRYAHHRLRKMACRD